MLKKLSIYLIFIYPKDENKSTKMIKQNQKYSKNLHVVRKNTKVPKRHAKPLNYKSRQGISVLAMSISNDLKPMKHSTKFETNRGPFIYYISMF